MDQTTRQFSFCYFGLEVFCTVTFSDDLPQQVKIDYIMEGMVDWLANTSDTKSPIIRLYRSEFLRHAKRVALQLVPQPTESPVDTYDFESL